MTNDEKFRLQRRTFLRSLWQSLSGTPDFPVKLVMAALYLIGAVYVCVRQAAWRTLAGNIPLLSPLLKAAMEHALFAYLLVYAVSAGDDLPEVMKWQDSYLSPKSFVLVLGESYTGPVTVNLAHIPHILLGGSTGSGKSVLLKLLLMQALQKGAMVWVADFKGGVDYPHTWGGLCEMVFTESDLLMTLDKLVHMLEQRKAAFRSVGCANLDEYNQKLGCCVPRCIFACDEVAELLDRTGADNEKKKLLAQIENRLSTIARQGRAFGIHLILATQRPDANVLPGQIKNNMDFRVCGRAGNVLSQIILDNTSAAEQIPKDARGRFITGDGIVFQGYLFDEGQL